MSSKSSTKNKDTAKKESDEGSQQDDDEEAQWWSTGYDEVDRIPDGNDARLRVEIRESRFILFIDGDGQADKERWDTKIGAPVCIWEYEIPITGDDGKPKWGTTITCLKGRKTASGKPAKDHVRAKWPRANPYYVGFYTVADITDVWDDFLDGLLDEDGDGDDDKSEERGGRRRRRRRRRSKSDEPSLKMLPAKKKLLKKLRDEAKQQDGLRGAVFEVYRTKKWAARVGDEWEFVQKLTDEEIRLMIPETMDHPVDYRTLLAPKSEEEIDAILEIRADPDDYEDDRGRGGRRGRGRGRDDRDDDRGRTRGRGRGRDDDYEDRDDDRGRGRSRGRGRDDEDRDDGERDRGRSRSRGRDRDDDRDDRDQDRGRGRGRGRERGRDDEEEERGRSGRRRRGRDEDDGGSRTSKKDDDSDVGVEDDIDF